MAVTAVRDYLAILFRHDIHSIDFHVVAQPQDTPPVRQTERCYAFANIKTPSREKNCPAAVIVKPQPDIVACLLRERSISGFTQATLHRIDTLAVTFES